MIFLDTDNFTSGAVFRFYDEFKVKFENGVYYIGDVVIDTNKKI